ncbi:hypothetical protein Sjap_015366 [Stephania japonica]|uniref:Uncharacterized protein n=1 Tax=Stephania japonica TaxID=461633 RepID=A0AAP0IIZ7_9MAGN
MSAVTGGAAPGPQHQGGCRGPSLALAIVLQSSGVSEPVIAIADQRGPNDDSETSSTQTVSIEEFQTLTQRVAAQERQLEEILAILRASIVVALLPSTARVTITQKVNTPGVTTMTLLPTTTVTRPVMAVIPRASTEIAPATLIWHYGGY